jgi:anti-sigma regulatory factor (Ser/Thr protein kinase)
MRRWEIDEERSSYAVLLSSEVLTNAVLHAGSPAALTVAVADGTLEVGVGDHDSQTSFVASRTEEDRDWSMDGRLGGRGLRLVESLADDWGVTPVADGKQVWFRLDVGDDWPHRTACPCQGQDLQRVRLESGRYALAVPGPWDND